MGKLIESLGIDPWILAAQLFNFLILLFLLYKFGYKHILQFVNERTQKIEDGLKNAEHATEALQEAQKEQERIIALAREEGRTYVATARSQAEAQVQEILDKNDNRIKELNSKHQKDMSALKEQMMKEVRNEAATLIISVTEKILREKVDSSVDKKMVEKYLAESRKV